ncbi:tyrosine-protein phosphatase YwqE [Clostridium ragsdalei P11]|uniref:protein-tyrosine-phosphatase n=1 Tax=Clostridium ragsdalei P11 TaxID=1353534 RepID=A0A1A6AII6_9CLOT|nr:CpsB/CapC family capsule biosynthesis tyrosine phosphatase [Clostridium ragsdalei]OBR89877.1 tyrosine-protein phosphatase YwqE [Clostridium ragsdalei P11]
MIDIHSHILPGIDDGSKSMEDTMNMLRLTEEDGVETIAATPHFYKGYYENSYKDVLELVDKVRNEAKQENICVNIVSAQEVFLDRHTVENFKSGEIGCIEGTNYMLVELPMMNVPKNALDIIYELEIRGVHPILAHPERYKYIIDTPSKINEFMNEKCLLQVNTGSVLGLFGKKVKKTAELLIESGVCSFIASDAHSTGGRCPGISKALEEALRFNKDIEEQVLDNCKKMLKNEIIQLPEERIKERKGIFSFFRR